MFDGRKRTTSFPKVIWTGLGKSVAESPHVRRHKGRDRYVVLPVSISRLHFGPNSSFWSLHVHVQISVEELKSTKKVDEIAQILVGKDIANQGAQENSKFKLSKKRYKDSLEMEGG